MNQDLNGRPRGAGQAWHHQKIDEAEMQRRAALARDALLRNTLAGEPRDEDDLAPARPLVYIAVVAFVAILAIALMGYCAPARAQTWGAATLHSYHGQRDQTGAPHLRDSTPGAGIEHGTSAELLGTPIRALAGVQRNSYYGTPRCEGKSVWRCGLSVYAGGSWQPVQIAGIKAGLAAGLITGYPIVDGMPAPMAAVLFSVEGRRLGANLVIVPGVGEKSHGADGGRSDQREGPSPRRESGDRARVGKKSHGAVALQIKWRFA